MPTAAGDAALRAVLPRRRHLRRCRGRRRPLIDELHACLRAPVYPPFLGRRSCPPAHPVNLAVHQELSLEAALQQEPWHAAPWYQKLRRRDDHIDLVLLLEARPGEQAGDSLRDQPVSFAAEQRRHALRTIRSTTVTVPHPQSAHARVPAAGHAVPLHDPFSFLEEEGA
ncbi:type I-E CRISPR-associated protein Cas5/CasD [Streptomyces sp. NPDC020681]|uniref:type I-E CRISPR-associated protein Cas5/CasD n=1 Tax=Streptomyces sp. NPDC020681 TaxID=3365083 RepID=UPI0037968DC0